MTRTAILIAFALLTADAQDLPKDVTGWQKVTWEMSLDQVRAAYPAATAQADEYWSHLTLPAVDVADIPMHVDVSARKPSDKVSLISLWCYFGLPDSPPGAIATGFESLKALLIQKYGRPKNHETTTEAGTPVELFLWTFPSTSIQLRKSHKPISAIGSLRIEYRAIGKSLDVI